jgi:hypothetical protein
VRVVALVALMRIMVKVLQRVDLEAVVVVVALLDPEALVQQVEEAT